MRVFLTVVSVFNFLACFQVHAAKVVVVAGSGEQQSDAPAAKCRLREPFGIEFSPDGSMWIAEMVSSNRLLRVDSMGILRIVAANEKGFSGDGDSSEKAAFNGMHNLAISPNGDVYLADTWNYRVRKIDGKTGIISTFAGTGRKGFSGDGQLAREADFGSIIQIALDRRGEFLYIADIDNRRIRRVEIRTGLVETIAGNGQKGVPADGAVSTEAPLVDPRAVVPSENGFYVLERGGNALRFVDVSGKIRTVAGTGKAGLSGDGGPAREATLNGPKHLCMAPDGSVVIADAENHVIRRFDPTSGTITRVAGTGRKGSMGIGAAPENAELNRPHGVTIGPDGALFIVDTYNDRILKIEK